MAVYFSPHGGCTEAVVNALASATNTVLVQAYTFTSQPIAAACVAAKQRGVDVEVIVDKNESSAKGSKAGWLAHAGVPTFTDGKHAIAHNKVMVIDGREVLTGSFNFTKQAENENAENLLAIDDTELAAKYTANWHEHREHSNQIKP